MSIDLNPDESDPYPSDGTGYLVFEWNLPIDVSDEVQSDSVAFSLNWTAKQTR